MKIDLSNLRPSTLEIPEQVASLLERLKKAEGMKGLVDEMKNLKEWPTLHGKSELVRWAPVLNRLDEILELGTNVLGHKLIVDVDESIKSMVEVVLKFSAQVFENTTSRSSYCSVDRLLALMDSSDPRIIIEVLLVFQVMGKRSRFLSNRLMPDLQKRLMEKLVALTECWGGRLRDVKLTDCVKPELVLPAPLFPFSFSNSSGQSVQINRPGILEDGTAEPLLYTVEAAMRRFDGDAADRASLVARVRLLAGFDSQTHRVDWLIARLLAMSTLLAVHSRCGSDELHSSLPQQPPAGFIEQTCSLLHLDDSLHERVDMIKAEALRTLTAVCSTETKPHRLDSTSTRRRLLIIMEQLGATSYHGFLATYVRSCVEDLKTGQIGKPGHPSIGLCTALFSLLYHMASLDHPRRTAGANQESLISAGITQTMLSVIGHHDLPAEYTSFVTRCVRVIDVVSALDVTGFIAHKGMETCVNRLCYEVEECKKEQPFVIDVAGDVEAGTVVPGYMRTPKQTIFCHHQRGALIKSLLNFLKRIINERDFVEQVRHLMEYGLPAALRHIFSNVEYYSAALFHYSMQLVQNFVYQEPVQLTLLQNHNVPYTLLVAVLRKDIEPTRDVITTMCQVFSALCLNERGMTQFKKFNPFDEMLRIVLTAKYINTMKRRRGGDLMDDCSYNVGTTLDDLLRQHNSLRELCLDSFISTLKRLIALGTDPAPEGVKIVMTIQKAPRGYSSMNFGLRDLEGREDSVGVNSPREAEEASDEDIDPASVESAEEEMDATTSAPSGAASASTSTMSVAEKATRDTMEMTTVDSTGTRVLPLGDYMCILTRIVEVLLAASPVVDMTDGLVTRGGVSLLLRSMNLPQLQMELAASQYPNVVANIVRHAVGGQPNLVARHPAPNAQPVREEVMAQLVQWATKTLAPYAELAKGNGGNISLLMAMASGDTDADAARLCTMAADVLNVTAMLVGVTKCAAVLSSSRENDLRSKVIQMWTEEGHELHSMLHRISNLFSWEQGVITALRYSAKRKKEQAMLLHSASEAELMNAAARNAAAPPGDNDSVRALGDAGSNASLSSDDIDMMEPSTSGGGDGGADDGIAKADREWREALAASIGLSREECDFYQTVVKKGDFCKQFYKALRSVQELLGYFSRVCIGNTTRTRRGGAYDAATPYNLTKHAQKLVSIIFTECLTDIEYSPILQRGATPIGSFYLADVLANLHPLLMDDKKSQYHHLIARFYSSGCYKSVLGLMTNFIVPELIDRSISPGYELLLAEWCRLMTALSVRSGLAQSRYKMVDAQAKLFPTDKYYILFQTDLFNELHALIPVLKKSHSKNSITTKPQITETLFKLLSEVTKNLAELREEELENNGVVGEQPVSDAEANAIQRLMDMGFDRAACVQALAETTSVTEAMDMLLVQRDLAVGGGGQGGAAALMNRFGVLAEEGEADPWLDAMLGVANLGGAPGAGIGDEPEAFIAQAVLRRRGVVVPEGAGALAAEAARAAAAAAGNAAPGAPAADAAPADDAAAAAAAAAAPAALAPEAAAAVPGTSALPGPSTPPVPPVAEELSKKEVKLEWEDIVEKTTLEWIPLMLELSQLKKTVPTLNRLVYHVADITNAVWAFASDDWKRETLIKRTLRDEILRMNDELRYQDEDRETSKFRLGCLIHFGCLVYESIAADYIKVLAAEGKGLVTTLLDLIDYAANFTDLDEYTVSTIVNPTLLWLEMYDKYSHYVRRLAVYEKCEQPLVFSYYSFEDRYNAARGRWTPYTPAVCKKMTKAFMAGEQAVAIKHGRRDYIVDLVDLIQSQEGSTERASVAVMLAESDVEQLDVEAYLAMEKAPIYAEVEMAKMVNVLVSLLKKQTIPSYGAHSALELLVRVTRDETVAAHFVNNKGLEAMMKVRGQSVRCSEALFTQLVRQCIEDESMMIKQYDSMVRNSCAVGVKPLHSATRWQAPSYSKDALQVLSFLSHTATRSPLHYYKALLKHVRLDKNGAIAPIETTVKVVLKTDETKPPATPTTKAAVTAAAAATPTTSSTSVVAADSEKKDGSSSVYTGPGLAIIEMLLSEALGGDWSHTTPPLIKHAWKPEEGGGGLIFRLFTKSTLLYTLAELVRSYPFVATTITDLKHAEGGPSVMSLLMDKYSDPTIEKDTSNALHVLLATLAMNTSTKAHDAILNDIKNCLVGFAAAPETHTNVHLKINELALVLSSMMTACQPTKKDTSAAAAGAAAAQGGAACNNSIVKLAVKKRILNELIRCATRLVLSKRESIETVNSVIRTIDEMTKACNMVNPLGAIPQLATTRDGRLMQTMNELFSMQNMNLDGTGPQATLRRVDLAPNGDMTEAVVQIDVNGLDAAGIESMMQRVNAAVEIATREVDRRNREGEPTTGRMHVHVAQILAGDLQPLDVSQREVDEEAAAEAAVVAEEEGMADLAEQDEMRSGSSDDEEGDDEGEDDYDHRAVAEIDGVVVRMGEHGPEAEDEDDGQGDEEDEEEEEMDEEERFENEYEDEHAAVMEEGDEDDEDEDDEHDDEEEEDEEEAAREDERERAQHALASAAAGGEEGEGERTAEDEGESEVEGDEDDEEDPFGAFEHIPYMERDAARIFMDIDSVRGAGGGGVDGWPGVGGGDRFVRELGWGRDLQELLAIGGGGAGISGGYPFDSFGGPSHRAIARWDQSPERTSRAAGSGSLHPLLQRPPSRSSALDMADPVVASLSRQRSRAEAAAIGRMTGGLESHRQRMHLIRQNAVRRTRDHARTDADFRRLLDMTAGAVRAGGLGGGGGAPIDIGFGAAAGGGAHAAGLHHTWREFDPMYEQIFGGALAGTHPHLYGGAGAAGAEDHQARVTSRLLTESCPTTIERFRESSRVLDDVHGNLIACILNSIVHHKYKKEESDARAKIAAAEAAKKEEAERVKREKEAKEAKERAERAAANPITIDDSPSAEAPPRLEEEERMEESGEVRTAAEGVPMEVEDLVGPGYTEMRAHRPREELRLPTPPPVIPRIPPLGPNDPLPEDEDESMDTTSPSAAEEPAAVAIDATTTTPAAEGAAAAVAAAGVEEMAEGEHSNEASSTGAVMGDEASLNGDGQQLTSAAADAAAAAAAAQAQAAAAAAAAAAAPPAPEMQDVPEEYRGILGCDTIPAGVDPAFLAALPDDMRAEVLRDHERQQRQTAMAAARAAAPPPAAAAPAAAPAADGSAAPAADAAAAAAPIASGPLASAPGIEPLDPDFLSALPAELQIEIIEQHERAVRQANAAAAAAAAPPVPQPADDPAEVIRSLPPSLRAQVLADADDSVLQVLPHELAEEARRLRNDRAVHTARMAGEREYHRQPRGLAVRAPAGAGRLGGAGRGAAALAAAAPVSGVGHLAGSTLTASVKGVQMLDRDAISALVIMFFADARLNQARLQKTLRDLCTHKGTCDYLIYALLAILKQISVNKHREEEEQHCLMPIECDPKPWTDTITAGGVGHNERVVKIDKEGGVSIHPLHAPAVAKNVVELLVTIARSYPGHFIPHVLRKETAATTSAAAAAAGKKETATAPPEGSVPMPPFEHFWQTVYSYTTSKAGASAKEGLPEHRVETLEDSPLAHLMALLQCDVMKTTAGLSEKLLKVVYAIVQTLPDDTLVRLKRDGRRATQADMMEESSGSTAGEETPLCAQLKLVCGLLTSGTCTQESLHDGRLLLVEAMRAMNFRTTETIYDMLVKRIEKLGLELEPQIGAMLSELASVPEGAGPSTSTGKPAGTAKYDADLSREQRRRTEMERENMFHALHSIRNDQRGTGVVSSCAELQVPSVRALQEKSGVQSAMLSALQTICKVRDTLGLLMADRKKKRADEAQRRFDKATKEWAEKRKKRLAEKAAAAAAAAAAAEAASVDGAVAPVSSPAAEETPAAATAPAAAAEPPSPVPADASAAGSPMDTTSPSAAAPAAAADAAAEAPAAVPAAEAAAAAAAAPPPAVTTASAATQTAAAVPAWAPAAEALAAATAEAADAEEFPAPKLEQFLDHEHGTPIPELKLSQQLSALEGLWEVLSECLQRLGRASDPHAILVLQPAAEAFFLVHAVTAEKAREAAASRDAAAAAAPAAGAASTSAAPVAQSTSVEAAAAAGDEDTTKLLQFAEKHRSVLNQVLRQNQASLTEGPFAILAVCPKLLDFDVKRTHFRKQLGKMDDRQRYRRDDVPLRIRRAHIFSDSFRELFRLRGNEWKARFYIMFEGEEGQDAGGLLREWFSVITREIFNPNYALFNTAPGDRSTYMINKASYINPEHLDYFKFVGRIIAKAIHDNKLLDCYFTRAFYKHILNLPVKYQDLESEDPEFYKSFEYLLNNPVETMGIDLNFTLEVEEFGVVSTRPLKEGGAEMVVTDENKEEYVRLVCQMKMTSSIRRQLDAFLDGFYEVIPKQLIAMFNEQELELLISGLPDVDIDDLAANTEYRSYNKNSREIQWFWRALRSFEPEDRAKFLQFVTGTSKVPLNGFGSLEGMNGAQKFSIHQDSRTGNRLPAAHTCFNQLDLPVYDSYEKLREAVLLAVRECTEGFGFA